MHRGVGEERHGGNETNSLLVVNPQKEIIVDHSDRVRRATEGYGGEVYRLDNIDRMENAAEFYENQEELMNQLYDIAEEGEHVDPFWYDDAFLFDSGGLDSADQKAVTSESSTLEFLGGPLEDISTVIASIEAGSQEASYILNRNLVFDYGAWDSGEGYVEDELTSLEHLLEADEPGMQERLQHHRLDRDNVHL
jgi:hypothetical protein